MPYNQLDPKTHCFEMEDCMGCFSFTQEAAAKQFFAKVRALKPSMSKSSGKNLLMPKKQAKKSFFSKSKSKKTTAGFKPMAIGEVTNVKHVQHVGVNVDGTLDSVALNPEWKKFFKKAGVRKADLKNPAMAKTVMSVIEQSGYSLAAGPGTYTHVEMTQPVIHQDVKERQAHLEHDLQAANMGHR